MHEVYPDHNPWSILWALPQDRAGELGGLGIPRIVCGPLIFRLGPMEGSQ